MHFYFKLILINLILISIVDCNQTERIKLSDIEFISLYKDKLTTGRRTAPIDQLKCIGSYYKCAYYSPSIVQCFNRGYDGNEYNWECKAELDRRVKFGDLKVNCEGYDFPNDPYILNGSCGLKYSLESTKLFKNYNEYYNNDLYETSKLSNFLTLIIMIVIISAIYKSCNRNRENDTRREIRDLTNNFSHVVDNGYHETNLTPNSFFPPPPPPYGFIVSNNLNNTTTNSCDQAQQTSINQPQVVIKHNASASQELAANQLNVPSQSNYSSQDVNNQLNTIGSANTECVTLFLMARGNSGSSLSSSNVRMARRSESPPPAYQESSGTIPIDIARK